MYSVYNYSNHLPDITIIYYYNKYIHSIIAIIYSNKIIKIIKYPVPAYFVVI